LAQEDAKKKLYLLANDVHSSACP